MSERVILFPTDFSERSLAALDQALHFSEKFDDKIIIFHVYPRPYDQSGDAKWAKSKLIGIESEIEKKFTQIRLPASQATRSQPRVQEETGDDCRLYC